MTPPPPPPPEVARARAAGRTLGRYTLLDELGRGGMGVVLRAWDDARGLVALKLIDPAVADPELVVRLAREADAGATLDHPAIVRPLDAGVVAGRSFIAFELVPGRSLGSKAPPAGDLPLRDAVRALRDVARGLAHAHARGVIHRDLKPGNILVDPQGGGKLIDFGLARLVHDRSRLTATGTILGTPEFMSPEQALGTPAAAPADAWGLGAVLFFILCGRPPFTGPSTVAVLRSIIEDAPLRPSRLAPRVDPALEALCLACLAKEPAARPTAQGVADELERWLRGGRARGRRRPRALGVAALLASAGAVAVAVRLATTPTTTTPTTTAPAPPPTPPTPTPTPTPTPATEAAATEAAPPPLDGEALAERLEGVSRALAVHDPRAREELAAILAEAPDHPLVLVLAGGEALKRGALDEAEALADRVIARAAPGRWEGLCLRGAARVGKGLAEPGLQDLDRAVEHSVSDGPEAHRTALRNRSRWARVAGRLPIAQEDAEAALRLEVDAQALAALVLVQAEWMHFGEAAEVARALDARAERDPLGEHPEVLRARSLGALLRDEVETARRLAERIPAALAAGQLARAAVADRDGDLAAQAALLEAALRLEPGDAGAWASLAIARVRQGDPRALEAATRATELAPTFPRAWHAVLTAHQVAGRYELSLQAAERVALLDPDFPTLTGTLVNLHVLAGDHRGALELVRERPLDSPQAEAQLLGAVAMAHLRRGDLQAARAALERRARYGPSVGLAQLAELEADIAGGDVPALAAVEEAIGRYRQVDRDSPEGLRLLALLALRRGDPAGAARAAEAALALGAERCSGELHLVLARARLAQSDPRGARASAEAELALRPRSVQARLARGEALLALGEPQAALADAALAGERDPDLAAVADLARRAREAGAR